MSTVWEKVKEIIHDLYIKERRPLEGPDGVREYMKSNHGFDKSKSQYTTQLAKWGFGKYNKAKATPSHHFKIASYKVEKARARGKALQPYHKGRLITPKVLRTHGYLTSIEKLAFDQGVTPLLHLSSPSPRTPPDFQLRSPSLTGASGGPLSHIRDLESRSLLSNTSPSVLLLPSLSDTASDFLLGNLKIHPVGLRLLRQQLESFVTSNGRSGWGASFTHPKPDALLDLGGSSRGIRQTSGEHLVQFATHVLSDKLFRTQDHDLKAGLYEVIKASSALDLLLSANMICRPSAKALLESIFTLAVEAEDSVTVRRLLAHGLNPDGVRCRVPLKSFWPGGLVDPLHYAFRVGNIELAEVLIDHSTKCFGFRHWFPNAIIEIAIWGACRKYATVTDADSDHSRESMSELDELDKRLATLVDSLLRLGADIHAHDTQIIPRGSTALHWAAEMGLEKTTRLLIQHGADLLVCDIDGENPLQAALTHLLLHTQMCLARRERTYLMRPKGFPLRLIECLLQAGANPNEKIVCKDSGRQKVRQGLARCRGGGKYLVELAAEHSPEAVTSALSFGAQPTALSLATAFKSSRFEMCFSLFMARAAAIRAMPSKHYYVEVLQAMEPSSSTWLMRFFDEVTDDTLALRVLSDIINHCRLDVTRQFLRGTYLDVEPLLRWGWLTPNGLAALPVDLFLNAAVALGKGFVESVPADTIRSCILRHNTPLASCLIQSGLDVDAISKGWTADNALCAAIRLDNDEVFRRLIKHKARYLVHLEDLGCPHTVGLSALVEAAIHGNKRMMEYMVKEGANVNVLGLWSNPSWDKTIFTYDCDCITPLAAAILSAVGGDYGLVNYLIGLGANLNPPPSAWTPLSAALMVGDRLGSVDLAMELLVLGASPFDKEAVAVAGKQQLELLVETMVKQAAGRPQPTTAGGIALARAVMDRDEKLVRTILTAGLAICEGFSLENRTPLDYALDPDQPPCSPRIIKLLLEAGYRPSPEYGEDRPDCLYLTACGQNSPEVLRLLLGHDIDPLESELDDLFAQLVEKKWNGIISQLLAREIIPGNDSLEDHMCSPPQGLARRLRLPSDTVYAADLVQLAVLCENYEAIRLLADAGVTVNGPPYQPCDGGATALQFAVAMRSVEAVRILVDCGADLNMKVMSMNPTALYLAASLNEVEILKLLIDKGADVNASCGQRGNAVQAAVEGGSLGALKFLIESRSVCAGSRGCVVLTGPLSVRATLLQFACHKGLLDTIQYLVEELKVSVDGSGDEPPHKLGSQWHYATAIQPAAEAGHFNVVQYLLARGADPNRILSARASACFVPMALQLASSRGYIDIAKLLIEHGADVNALPPHGDRRTVLQAAAEKGRFSMAQLLLDNGAELRGSFQEHTDKALRLAKENGHHAVSELIREHLVRPSGTQQRRGGCGGGEDTADLNNALPHENSERFGGIDNWGTGGGGGQTELHLPVAPGGVDPFPLEPYGMGQSSPLVDFGSSEFLTPTGFGLGAADGQGVIGTDEAGLFSGVGEAGLVTGGLLVDDVPVVDAGSFVGPGILANSAFDDSPLDLDLLDLSGLHPDLDNLEFSTLFYGSVIEGEGGSALGEAWGGEPSTVAQFEQVTDRS